MKPNIGRIDRTIRIVLGLLIAAAGIFFESWWGLLGLVILATALIRFCPLYTLLGTSTVEKSE
ncbi:MAG: DUF2892 domain-containing protein [Bacteroidales bacterium]|jgi:type IV secretory pathway TrbD component|nr:DUF2892 domain-containing protein [Bacteroidales bacterium]